MKSAYWSASADYALPLIFIIKTTMCNLNYDLDVIYDVISLDWKMAPCRKVLPNIFLVSNQQNEDNNVSVSGLDYLLLCTL